MTLTRSARLLASAGLLAALAVSVSACTPRHPVILAFSASWHGQPLHCDSSGTALTDLRLFISEVALIDSSGAAHELTLTPDGRWQQAGVALIDLENGAGNCVNGSAAMNNLLRGSAKATDFESVRFTVGVPFHLNHANPLLAESPLDDSAMHWHWRSGYKFLRAGVANESDGFWMHLGSTACEGTVQNISGCRSPNRVTVTVAGFSATSRGITVDLAELFHAVDLNDGERSECSSGAAEAACTEPFAALGLAIGDAPAPAEPRPVFRVTN